MGTVLAMHVDPDSLRRAVDALGAVELESHELSPVLSDAAAAITELMSATGTGIMLADEGAVLRYVSATDEAARLLEQVQEEKGVGPCIDCVVVNEVVVSGSLALDERWPTVSEVVVPAGVRSIVGAPVLLGGAPVGSLNIYDAAPRDWDESDLHAARTLARSFSALLEQALRTLRGDQLVEQLQYALDNRVVIERAVGYLMASLGVDTVEAFNRLRRRARAERAAVADVAAGLLADRAHPPTGW